jgi:hypothetical protein
LSGYKAHYHDGHSPFSCVIEFDEKDALPPAELQVAVDQVQRF